MPRSHFVSCTTARVMHVANRTARSRIQAPSRLHRPLLGPRATSPTMVIARRCWDSPHRACVPSRRSCNRREPKMSLRRKKGGVEIKDNSPSHDGGRRHSLGPPLGLVIFVPVRLVDDLFGNDLFDDICVYVWRPRYAYWGCFVDV